jgi:hypothetical protein
MQQRDATLLMVHACMKEHWPAGRFFDIQPATGPKADDPVGVGVFVLQEDLARCEALVAALRPAARIYVYVHDTTPWETRARMEKPTPRWMLSPEEQARLDETLTMVRARMAARWPADLPIQISQVGPPTDDDPIGVGVWVEYANIALCQEMVDEIVATMTPTARIYVCAIGIQYARVRVEEPESSCVVS